MQSFKEFGEFILKNSQYNLKRNSVHIILNYPKIKWDDYAEYMATLTWFSGTSFSVKEMADRPIIFSENLDHGTQSVDAFDYALVSYIGSFYYSEWYDNIHKAFYDFCLSGQPCKGHLLFHPRKQYGYLHPQTIFINLKHWRKINKPNFGLYSGEVLDYERSKENIHDDYTPLWIKPGTKKKYVYDAPQGNYISKVLEDGCEIYNFGRERKLKFFCYPERRKCEILEIEKNRPSNIIYTNNTEKLPNLKFYKQKFDVIYCPASGLFSEYLWKYLGHENTKLVIFDNNKDSLRWKQLLYEMVKDENDINQVTKYFSQKGCIIDNAEYKNETVKFNNNIFPKKEFIEVIQQVKPIFKYCNVIEEVLSIDTDKKNFIFLSNIFSYNFIIHKMKITDIHNQFLKYCSLPNTTIFGENIFKRKILNETTS